MVKSERNDRNLKHQDGNSTIYWKAHVHLKRHAMPSLREAERLQETRSRGHDDGRVSEGVRPSFGARIREDGSRRPAEDGQPRLRASASASA